MKDLLPIGTVVTLKEGVKSLMIIGIMQTDENEKVYDYIAVLYPEGFLNAETFFLFNNEDIVEVKFNGYIDAEYKEHIKLLDEYIQEN